MAMRDRPLSPHLQVYRPMYTMVLSIAHRAAGLALSAGSLLLAWWLMAVASGEAAYASATEVLSAWPVKLVLTGFMLAFWYHLFAGLRHLAWDAGYGFAKAQARRSGRLVVVLTVLGFVGGALYWHFAGGGA
jgi:succinate dehydrogenase / fumarate reductase, cytochrome b subunit